MITGLGITIRGRIGCFSPMQRRTPLSDSRRRFSLPPLQGRVLRPPKPNRQLGAGQLGRIQVFVRDLCARPSQRAQPRLPGSSNFLWYPQTYFSNLRNCPAFHSSSFSIFLFSIYVLLSYLILYFSPFSARAFEMGTSKIHENTKIVWPEA